MRRHQHSRETRAGGPSFVALFAIALLASAVGCGKPPAPVESTEDATPQFTDVEPEIPVPESVDSLMEEIVKIYVAAPQWHVEAQSTWTAPAVFARPPAVASWRLDFQRPFKLRLETTPAGDESPRTVMVSDGEVRSLFVAPLNRYSTTTAAASLAAALDDREFVLADGSPRRLIAPFLEQAAWDEFWAGAEEKEKVELLLRDGVPQFQARWRTRGATWTAYIRAVEPKRILRLEAVGPTANSGGREGPGESVVETYEYAEAAPADAFNFVPPPTTTQVADFALTYATSEDELRGVVGRWIPDVPVAPANAAAGTAPVSLQSLAKGTRVARSVVRRATVLVAVDVKSPDSAKVLTWWQEIAPQFTGKNLGLMVVCESATPADALALARRVGLPPESFQIDANSALSTSLGTKGLPVTLLLDRFGFVRRSLLGASLAWSDSVTAGAVSLIRQEEDAARLQAQLSAVAPPQALVQALGHIDPLVQQTAARKLRELKTDSVPVLTVGSADPDPQVRLLTLSLLGELSFKHPEVAPVLASRLTDPNADVRTQARRGLVRMGSAAIPLLRASLASPNPVVRREAATALGSMRYRAFAVIPDITVCLGDPDPTVRRAAGEALVRLGRKSLPALAEALKNPNPALHEAAAKTLVRFGSRGATYIVAALKEPPEFLPPLAAKIGPTFAPTDAARVAEALRVYETAKSLKDRPTPDLIPLLGDAQTALASAAADVLASRGEAAVPSLSDMLSSDKRQVRRLAAEALGRIGPAAFPAWDYLRIALKDSAPEVRAAAAEAAGKIGPAVLEPLTAELRQATDSKVKAGVMRALAEMGPSAAPAKDAFVANLTDGNADVRAAAAEALGAIGSPGLAPLLAALDHENSDVQVAAVRGLGRLGGDAVESLVGRLSDPKSRKRVWAAVALGEIGVEAQPAIPTLRSLANDPDGDVRLHAQEADQKIAKALTEAQDEEGATAQEATLPTETLAPDAAPGAGNPAAADGSSPKSEAERPTS